MSKVFGIRSILRISPPSPTKLRVGRLHRRHASVKTDNIDWDPMKTTKQLTKGRELEAKHSRRVFFGLLCLTPVVTFFLGCWQFQRLKWKNRLVADCEDRLTYKPLPLPKSITPDQLADFEYRRVLITGEFDYSREVFVGPRVENGLKGYVLMCPFVQSNGAGEVLVNRGWIREDKVVPGNRRLQHLSCPQGEITIECLLRVPPKKGRFHMDHEKGSKLYTYLDIDAMAEELHSRPIYAVVVQNLRDRPEWLPKPEPEQVPWWKFWSRAKPEEQPAPAADDELEFSPLQFMNAGVPLGKPPTLDYKNNHLQYLVTWWGICVVSAILLRRVIRNSKIVNPKMEKMQHANKYLG
ncbi:hypothetical protein OGAPHI_002454 [Ogataea philodendri]|uniref:SURF1-like protein n=1 Tax=Ogataea philodendri TaxID=1378263 RepID=A0A9P8PBJ1_9ASCO|nr:uncharacterized protein OGAPHI_002454 [Ogataea philodendri]KAH3668700.1 hypothetical protein OGAPHI_002454 [Ogataea philodendri]